MPYRVELLHAYFHPRTHKRISQDKARLYRRRTGKRIKPQRWLIVRNVVGDTRGLAPEQIATLKKRAGRIEYASRLTRTEAILRLSSVKERHVRRTFADHRIFKKLYDDFEVPGDLQRRGAIRLTINGTLEGRRIKEVIHLGFMKREWESRYGRPGDAKERFKDWLVGVTLSNLRRRGLRLSDPVESAGRVRDLEKKRHDLLDEIDKTPPQFTSIIGGKMEQLKWATEAIRQQKKSKQLRGVTIRVEKLI
jgi:hypothetical protein